MRLTKRQNEVLLFVAGFQKERGYPPTVREIGSHFKFGPRASKEHLDSLERKGYIRRGRGARTIQITSREELNFDGIPIIGRVAAGVPLISFENLEGYLKVDASTGGGKDVFSLRVKGESMVGIGILDGDYVIVEERKNVANGDVIVARIRDEATVKEFRKKGDCVKLIPHNSKFRTLQYSREDDFEIIGKVVGLWRNI